MRAPGIFKPVRSGLLAGIESARKVHQTLRRPDMEWLQEHMRKHVSGNSASVSSIDEHSNFRYGPLKSSARTERTSAIDLVYQAADAIRDTEEHATAIEANAQSLAKRAIEELQGAERRIQAAETARRAAEAQIGEANARIQQAERVLEMAESRIQALEVERANAELRAKAAEKRAAEVDAELARVEKAIRTRLLKRKAEISGNLSAAA